MFVLFMLDSVSSQVLYFFRQSCNWTIKWWRSTKLVNRAWVIKNMSVYVSVVCIVWFAKKTNFEHQWSQCPSGGLGSFWRDERFCASIFLWSSLCQENVRYGHHQRCQNLFSCLRSSVVASRFYYCLHSPRMNNAAGNKHGKKRKMRQKKKRKNTLAIFLRLQKE